MMFRRIGLIFLISFMGQSMSECSVLAAMTIDASTTVSASGSSVTQAHTVAADANGMVVAIRYYDSINGTVSVTSMTFNGDNLTLANRDTFDDGSSGSHTEIWYMVAPDTGTHDLIISFSASATNVRGAVVSLKSFKQTGQPDGISDGNHNWCSNPDSDSVTVSTPNSWVFDAARSSGGTFGSPSSGQTQLGSSTASYKADVGAGSVSMGWGFTGCNSGAHALAAFAPAADGGYAVSEGRFTGGGGSGESTNYKVTESSFEQFGGAAVTSANYKLETKIGVGGAGIGTINSVSPVDYSKFFHDSTASYTISAASQDGDALQYKAKQDSTTKAGPQSSGTLSWSLSASDIGRHTVSLEVIDPNGTTLKKQEAYVVRRPTK